MATGTTRRTRGPATGKPGPGPFYFQRQNDQALAQLRTFQTALRHAFPRDGRRQRGRS